MATDTRKHRNVASVVDSANQERGRRKERQTHLCFVLMPFKSDFDAVYENAIRPAINSSRGLSCLRADEIYGPRPIMADVWRSIRQAFLIVADLTGRNPNVLYELGLAHAIQKPVVLLTQTMDDVPFDLRSIRCLLYRNDRDGREILRVHLHKAISEFLTDLSKGDEQELGPYVVLPAHNLPKTPPVVTPGRRRKVITELHTSEPSKLLRALRALKESAKEDQGLVTDPVLLGLIVEHLKSQYLDIQFAAIDCIKVLGSKVYSHFLHPLVEHANPTIREAAVEAIAKHYDRGAEPLLLQRLQNESAPLVRQALIEALGRIGDSPSVKHFASLLHNETTDNTLRQEAIEVLCNIGSTAAIATVTSLDVERLDTSLREHLALNLGMIQFAGSFDAHSIGQQLMTLASDVNPRVVAAAYASWCLCSIGEDGFLDRDTLWKFLTDEKATVIGHFFDFLSEYRPPFNPSEGPQLVELAKRIPLIASDLVWQLHQIGGPDVAPFMCNFLQPEHKSRLWAFAYFARCPSKLACVACEKEMAAGEDLSHAFLAAVCLSKLGSSTATEFVINRIADRSVYSWVRGLGRPILEEARSQASTENEKAQIDSILQKLASS